MRIAVFILATSLCLSIGAQEPAPFKPFDKLKDQADLDRKVTRQLVLGTLQAHHLNKFGAVELATHRFYHPGDPNNIGEAETVMIWKWQDNAWKISRVISYDHHAAAKK